MPDIISNRQLHAVFAAFRTILTKSNGADQETSETDISTKSSKPRSARDAGKGTKGKNDHKEEKGKKEPEMARAASRKANKERGVDFLKLVNTVSLLVSNDKWWTHYSDWIKR